MSNNYNKGTTELCVKAVIDYINADTTDKACISLIPKIQKLYKLPNSTVKPMDANNLVKRHFNATLRRSGLRRIRFHDLRHTYATLSIDRGNIIISRS